MSSTEQTPRPPRVTAAAAVAGAEGVGLVGGGVFLLAHALTSDSGDLPGGIVGALTVVALGLIPLVAARGLWLLRSWSRGPAVITQLLALPVAWQMLQTPGVIPAGIVVAALAVTGLVLLVSRSTTASLGIRRPGQDTA
ncbi:hypothetical protein ACIRQY_29880 [Streptomyces sp. NPDC101490]|uniref:hypothetical protein n=1 Tax=unclassified Streptomyces TaxID=2593676 RepID=UPI00332AC7C9